MNTAPVWNDVVDEEDMIAGDRAIAAAIADCTDPAELGELEQKRAALELERRAEANRKRLEREQAEASALAERTAAADREQHRRAKQLDAALRELLDLQHAVALALAKVATCREAEFAARLDALQIAGRDASFANRRPLNVTLEDGLKALRWEAERGRDARSRVAKDWGLK